MCCMGKFSVRSALRVVLLALRGPRTKMTEICGGMVVEVLLLYLKWARVYTQSRARDPPLRAAIGSPRVIDPGRTLMRLMWARRS